ncbi:MAG TPA: hypothetical protein VMT38_05295 [Terracidiphilus sp.]|nr:hypothetical protein [Terracidiphilus sp.]
MKVVQRKSAVATAGVSLLLVLSAATIAQEGNPADVIRMLDAAVAFRVRNVAGFTDIEHYAAYRGSDESHPLAEMNVRDSYKAGVGKSYTVLSESGSSIVLRMGLKPLLENETKINQPDRVPQSWFTSTNYDMKLVSTHTQRLNGRECYALSIDPRQKAPNMIDGTLWVDAHDGSILKVEGVASKSPSVFAGTTHMMRRYVNIAGFPMAVYARAESDSPLFGHTVVTIDYRDYKLEIRPHP